jgi:hypothetical protein
MVAMNVPSSSNGQPGADVQWNTPSLVEHIQRCAPTRTRIEGQAHEQAAPGGQQVEHHVVPLASAAGHEPLEPLVGHAHHRRRERGLHVRLPARPRLPERKEQQRQHAVLDEVKRFHGVHVRVAGTQRGKRDRRERDGQREDTHPTRPIGLDDAQAHPEDDDAPEHNARRNDGDVLARERPQQRQPQVTDHGRAEHDGERRQPRKHPPQRHDPSRHVSDPRDAASAVSSGAGSGLRGRCRARPRR